MAAGLGQNAGSFTWPEPDTVGYQDWAQMTGMVPAHPLVGGSAGQPGYGAGQRSVVVADPGQAAVGQVAAGSPARASWAEVFNLKGNPIGWVLIASILYLGLMHIHVNAGGSVGFGKR